MPLEAKLYLQYDPGAQVLYALVLSVYGENVEMTPPDAFFIKIGGTKYVDGNTGDDDTPPDFVWVDTPDNVADHAYGWEASMSLAPGTYTDFDVHTNVYRDGGSQTSAARGLEISLPVVPLPAAGWMGFGLLALLGLRSRMKHRRRQI
jgi:hypothetical protein